MSSAAQQRTRIKICGLTREADVDCAVAAGADAVGFVLYPKSPRFVTAQRAAELARRLQPFVTPVLLFVNAGATEVIAASQGVARCAVQFHGDETAAECLAATEGGKRPFLRAARIPLDASTPFDLLAFASDFANASALLLDAHVDGYGGGGKAFDWSRITTLAAAAPAAGPALPHVVLSGGLTPANVGDGIAALRPHCRSLAVDVSSGVESAKGVKDPEKIHRFVAAVRAADGLLSRPIDDFLSAA